MLRDGPRVHRLLGWVLCLAALSACSEKITAPPEPPMSVRRGDDAFRYEQYSSAIDAYRNYLDQTEQGAYTARVMYKTALAEYRLGHYRATLSTLDGLAQRYPQGRWVQVEALRGDAERALGNTMMALQWWKKAWQLAGSKDRQKLRRRIMTAAQDLNDVELARARRLSTDDEFGALLDRQIAARQPPELTEPVPNAGDERTLDTSDTELANPRKVIEERTEPVVRSRSSQVATARAKLTQAPAVVEPGPAADAPVWSPPHVTTAPTEAPTEKVVASAEKNVPRGAAQIGCLLPMSGVARTQGERALRGVRLVFGADSSRLVIADTESDPAVATRMFGQLVRDPKVLAVIGPVRNNDAETVVRLAEEARLPLLLLSERAGLNGEFALQVGVTRTEQVRGLLDYAMGKMRLRRFGVLYPQDATGIVKTFRSDVEGRGGTIIGAVAYPSGAQSLMSEAATVRKWRDRENLQAVFLPDSAPLAGHFAQFLQRDMPDVMLVGVHGWQSLADQQKRLNGILFSDAFYADSERPATRAFVKRFQQAYGELPGLIEADAYDAATLAERALDRGATSPADMLRALHGLGRVTGAAGDVTVTAEGLQRSGFLLQLSAGRLEEIGESPSHMIQQAAVPEPPSTKGVAAAAPAAQVQAARTSPTTAPHAEAMAARAEPLAAVPPTDVVATDAKVACLLPLTGPDQAYGKRALAGLRLAFAGASEQLVVRDTGGDPATTADWLARLQADPQIVAVVGPLRSTEAEVAAPLAERQQLPLLLLSQREGLGGRFVLQVAMTRTQQVRLLVHHAVTTLKLRRFGVLYPNDGYGSAFADAFKKEVARQGGSIVGIQPYPPGTTSFASAVIAVRGWHRAGLDALFIPDAAPTSTALAADIRGEVPNVVLLGTESWNDAPSLAQAGAAIDGAIFADAFFADSARPSTRDFVERFQQQAGQAPTVFEAQAFDAGMALRKAIARGATSREQIIAGLTALGSFDGAGQLRIAPGGFERSVSLLRYHDGRVEEVPAVGTEG